MMAQLSTRMSARQLALGVLALFVALILLVTVLPWWLANSAYQSRLETVVGQLQRLQERALGDEKLTPRLEQLRHAQLTNGHYLKGGTEAVAAAELQRTIKTIAGRHRTQIMSSQILPVASEENFLRVALKVRMRGPLLATIETLHEVESQETFLFVERLTIETTARRGTTQKGISDQFDTEFEVRGYMPEIADE